MLISEVVGEAVLDGYGYLLCYCEYEVAEHGSFDRATVESPFVDEGLGDGRGVVGSPAL
jgi:hypothetical protein